MVATERTTYVTDMKITPLSPRTFHDARNSFKGKYGTNEEQYWCVPRDFYDTDPERSR